MKEGRALRKECWVEEGGASRGEGTAGESQVAPHLFGGGGELDERPCGLAGCS